MGQDAGTGGGCYGPGACGMRFSWWAWPCERGQRTGGFGQGRSSAAAEYGDAGSWWESLRARPRYLGRVVLTEWTASLGEPPSYIKHLSKRQVIR